MVIVSHARAGRQTTRDSTSVVALPVSQTNQSSMALSPE